MSSEPNSVVESDTVASNVAKSERILAGFPWVSAIVLYTLSWGWSLLRPNTLYWDDWALDITNNPKSIWLSRKSSGLAPWVRLVEWPLLEIGVWTLTFLTFLLFFLCGIFVFVIFKKLELTRSSADSLVVLFLIVPVNHARVSVTIFDYTNSYFLFYLGWFVLVYFKSAKSFAFACISLFLSLKTHSFLVFFLLPFLHFVWIKESLLIGFKKLSWKHFQIAVLGSLPFFYLLLRNTFWPPIGEWVNYQRPTISGLWRGLTIFVPSLLLLACYFFGKKKFRKSSYAAVLALGLFLIALGIFPYFLAESFPNYISSLSFRIDWGSRHQMLLPLGLALSVLGLNELVKHKDLFFRAVLVFSTVLNIYFASTYFLDSIKKSEIIQLAANSKSFSDESEIVLVDDTENFNGRGSNYRDYELSALLQLAGRNPRVLTGERTCSDYPKGVQLTLKSDTSYLQALATRDLGLYFEIKPCSEVLAQNN